MAGMRLNVPNIMGVTRLAFGFCLPLIAWYGYPAVFTGVLVCAFLLDAVDGPIARYHGETSVQGSRLDSIADFSVYCSLVIGVYLLWPDIFANQQGFIFAAVASILVPVAAGIARFGTFTSYHTWMVKIASVCIAVSSVLLIIGGPSWPFRLAVIVSVLAGLEELVITVLLDAPRSDVKHVFAVTRDRNDRDERD